MEEARAVLARLERIEVLDRGDAPPHELLCELRQLVSEAERWARVEHAGEQAEQAVDRCREALEWRLTGTIS